ncbi:MAG: ATP-binding cassette domain-containing protein, partial [Verrucomicrobiota bacterium]
MNWLRLIVPESRHTVVGVSLMTLVNGICSAGLVASGHQVLTSQSKTLLLPFAFLFLGLGKLVSGYFAEVLLTRYSQTSIARLRRNLVEKTLEVPLRKLEQTGRDRVIACLNEDVTTVNAMLTALPALGLNLAIMGGAAVYLCWLSPIAFTLLLICSVTGFGFYRLISKDAHRHWATARETGDHLASHYRAATLGTVELKMNAARRQAFVVEVIHQTTESYADQCVTATRRYTLAHSLSHAFFFLLIAALLFLFPRWNLLSPDTLSGYVITCLFLLGPLSGAIQTLPLLTRSRIALGKIENLGVKLNSPRPPAAGTAAIHPDWKQITLEQATFIYEPGGEKQNALHPTTLTLHRGDLLFVTGGNGSGKSTLARILCGLYQPHTGHLFVDGTPIEDGNRDEFRQMISV